VHKCMGSWVCIQDFVSVSLCAHPRGLKWPVNGKGTTRFVTLYVHMFAMHYKLYMYYVMYKMRQKSCRYRKVYDFSYKIESYTKLKALKTFVFVKDSLSENLILKICTYYSWTLKFDLNYKLFCICIYNFFKYYIFLHI